MKIYKMRQLSIMQFNIQNKIWKNRNFHSDKIFQLIDEFSFIQNRRTSKVNYYSIEVFMNLLCLSIVASSRYR